MEKLREEMARVIETENAYGYYAHHRALELAESILSIPALREIVEKATGTCEWTEEDGIVQTGCGTELWFDDIVDDHYAKQCPFCPCCGRRVKIKEDTNV